MINRSEEERLYWTGLKCDLIELAHIVWETGQLTDQQGRLMDFQFDCVAHLPCASRACPVQSLVCGIIRSGPQERASGALRERYLQLIVDAKIQDPMRLEIRRRRR